MGSNAKRKLVGILTSGGDCPGLNATIRGVGKALERNGVRLVGFLDGFTGLALDRYIELDSSSLSGILTVGGTILGTSRNKPHKMLIGDKIVDMTDVIVENYHKHDLDALVCLGGGGTQKNAMRLADAGLNVLTLPKTIDNDIYGTDVTFGFDTALGIATEAIDRLHSTATSHHRVIVVEIMGHRVGWLALGAGVAGGADGILIPEIPYEIDKLAEALRERAKMGKRFSIVAVAEGAMSVEMAEKVAKWASKKESASDKAEKRKASKKLKEFHEEHMSHTIDLTKELEKRTGLEARLSILGHLQRGGIPSAADRVLSTILGAACAEAIMDGVENAMVAMRNGKAVPVPLKEIAGKIKFVPREHQWIDAARALGVSFGD